MTGEDKAREVLAAHLDTKYGAELARMGDQSLLVLDRFAVAAMLTYGEQCREEGRLAALDEAAGVARGWPHHPAAIEIVRRIRT